MANEITVNATLTVAKDNVSRQMTTDGDVQFDLSNSVGNYAGGTISIGHTTHEAVPVTDASPIGWAWFKHVGDGNYISLGVDVGGTFYPFARLYENQVCVCHLDANATIYAKSDTADQFLEYAIFEE